MKVFPFGEGRTEEVIFFNLLKKCLPHLQFENFQSVKGITNFNNEIERAVRADLNSNADDICILVFCDVDKGREPDDVIKRFCAIFKKLSPEWDGEPTKHSSYKNIYFLKQAPSGDKKGLWLVLHLADVSDLKVPKNLKESNNTTDGYILAIGLEESVLNAFEEETGANTNGKLYELITKCVPSCFSNAGIIFEQDKDYLAAYLCASRFWVKHRTEDERHLTQAILGRAWKYNQEYFREVFASWIEAMTRAGGPML